MNIMNKKIKPKYSKKTCYNNLPVKVTRKEFNRCVKPFLSVGKRGPETKVSSYKLFNYILYVLHTGIQWYQLKPYRNEVSWEAVYYHFNRWCKDGSFENLFVSSVEMLDKLGRLDLSLFHIDGNNTVAKKGEKKSDTRDTNTKEEINTLRYAII